MVAKIEGPRGSFGETIYYMERKCEMGKGELLHKTLFTQKPSLYWKEMEDVAKVNPNVSNKCLHFSLNLTPGENLDKDKFTELGVSYLEKMGYGNAPYLMYIHNDKKHSHIHLIVSSVDNDGKWVNDSFSHNRSFNISRDLEKEFNLAQLEFAKPNNTRHFSLKEKAMLDHSFKNGLRRALCDSKAKPYLEHYLNQEEIKIILEDSNNQTCKLLLNDRFDQINDYLMEKGYCNKHIKGELLKILDQAIEKPTKDQYFKFLEENNIKISFFSKEGVNKYSYQFTDYDLTFKEDRLPKNFCYKYLNERFGSFTGEHIPTAEQKHILYNTVRPTIQVSSSIQEFLSNLNESNINYTFRMEDNQTKIYFSLKNLVNANDFNSESISKKFSYETLNDHFNDKQNPIISNLSTETIKDLAITQEAVYQDYIPHIPLSAGSSPKQDDNTLLNRKKKKKKVNREITR